VRPAEVHEVFRGHLLRVEVQRWTDPDREREVVRHPGAVAVVVLTGDDVVLVRQLRESVGEWMLEVPAGIRDVDGEPPEETGRREVLEETGYRLTEIEPLGRIHSSPGFSDEVVDLFLGRGERTDAAPEHGIEVVRIPRSEAIERVRRGDITDAKTVAALLLAERVSAWA
jgi:ADP-ribose pyrophosphatase